MLLGAVRLGFPMELCAGSALLCILKKSPMSKAHYSCPFGR